MRAFLGVGVIGLAFVLGCSVEGTPEPGEGDDGACSDDAPDVPWSGALTDANNYTYDVDIEIASIPVAENSDLTIEWSALTQDMWGQPLGPRQIETLSLIALGLTPEEVESGLEVDSLEQQNVMLYVFADVLGQNSTELSNLTLFGTDVDLVSYFESGYAEAWLLTLSTSDTPGIDTASAAFLVPTPDETTTQVSITNDTATADVDADLMSLEPVGVTACAPLNLSWDDVSTDGQGGDFRFHHIDSRFLAYFPGATPAALQADALVWKQTAAELWEAEVVMGEQGALLDGDLSVAGTPLQGVTDDGVWLFGLECSTCTAPVPKFLTVLEVE